MRIINRLCRQNEEIFKIEKVVHCALKDLMALGVSNGYSLVLWTGFTGKVNLLNSAWGKQCDSENSGWIRTGYIRVLCFENKLLFNFRLHFGCYRELEWTRWPEIVLKYIRWSIKWNRFSLSIDQACQGFQSGRNKRIIVYIRALHRYWGGVVVSVPSQYYKGPGFYLDRCH